MCGSLKSKLVNPYVVQFSFKDTEYVLEFPAGAWAGSAKMNNHLRVRNTECNWPIYYTPCNKFRGTGSAKSDGFWRKQ